jgi:hypothetical protein
MKPKRMEWISVKDRLPEKVDHLVRMTGTGWSDEVLAYGDYSIEVCSYKHTDRIWYMTDGDIHKNVTHWMPLPEPPA